jgi:hypothetical protein
MLHAVEVQEEGSGVVCSEFHKKTALSYHNLVCIVFCFQIIKRSLCPGLRTLSTVPRPAATEGRQSCGFWFGWYHLTNKIFIWHYL